MMITTARRVGCTAVRARTENGLLFQLFPIACCSLEEESRHDSTGRPRRCFPPHSRGHALTGIQSCRSFRTGNRIGGHPSLLRKIHEGRIRSQLIFAPRGLFVEWKGVRLLYGSPVVWDQAEGGGRTQIERTLDLLKQDIQEEQRKTQSSTNVKLVPHSSDKSLQVEKSKTLWQRFKAEVIHYYHGFRLLWLDIVVSWRLLLRVLRGNLLSRKERRQLVRTVSDLFRLVPFSIFVIVPFMEFLLPVALWLFPGMLPSTFKETAKEEEKTRRQLRVKLDMAKFLQDTLEELSLERKKAKEEGSKALEFAHFIKKIRNEGGYVSNAELLKFSKLFEDELTLENLATPQLRALCRIVQVQPIGTPNILRFQLMMKLRELIADDKVIASEGGVDKLTVTELQQACRARGMRALGLSVERLKSQLRSWLELSLNDKVPPSLLLLSRTMFLPEDMSFTDRLKNLFGVLPDSVAEEARMKLSELEGSKVDNKAKLELILSIEAGLQKEREMERAAKEVEAAKAAAAGTEKDVSAAEAALESAAAQSSSVPLHKDALTDAIPITDDKQGGAEHQPGTRDKAAKDLDASEFRVVEEVLHDASGALHEEKEDLAELKEQIQEHREDVEEAIVMVSVKGEKARESKAARRIQGRVDKMISSVKRLLTDLDIERDTIKEELIPPEDKAAIQERKQKLVAVNDLVLSLKRLQRIPDDTKIQRVVEVLTALDDNKDGSIDLDLALEVIELIGKENVKLSAEQVRKISELLRKEDKAEVLVEEQAEAQQKLERQEDTDSDSSVSEGKEETLKVPPMNSSTVPPPTVLGDTTAKQLPEKRI